MPPEDTDSIFGSFTTTASSIANAVSGAASAAASAVSSTPTVSSPTPTDAAKKKSIEEAIFEFFNLRQKYQKNIKHNLKIKKRKPRPKCVNCERPVGTIFTITDKQYAAVCGDKSSPCNLDILIIKGHSVFYKNFIETGNMHIATEKQKIIQNKLNILFGYITDNEGLKIMEDIINEYNLDVLVNKETELEYQKIIMSEERAEDIYKLQEEIDDKIRDIQFICARRGVGVGSASAAAARSAAPTEQIIQIYHNDLLPRIARMQKLKYPLAEMDGENLFQYNILPRDEILPDKEGNYVAKWARRA
jgi:hypothetical protein